MRIPTRSKLLAAVLPLALLVTGLIAASPAAARTPHVPTGMGPIESLAPYVAQTSCDPSTKRGTAKLMHVLTTVYAGTHANSVYACGTDGSVSEHYDGRAIDWMVSIRNSTQKAQAASLIKWMLAADKAHNPNAMARRLGVQYLIFNNKIWGSWGGGWKPYNDCAHLPQIANDNACHRTHMHISLSWNGATGRTSFWTKHRFANDYGPCRPRTLNWADTRAGVNLKQCPRYSTVHPAAHASATKVNLVTYSGARVQLGSTGPVVMAIQRALHLNANGSFGASTKHAVSLFQKHHHVMICGRVGPKTWRALLAAVK
jgi:hypothetical protein